MRVPNTAHTSRPWHIHQITQDFRLEDVWELPNIDEPTDFPRFVELIASHDLARSSSPAVRLLVAVRMKLGDVLGLDDPRTGTGARVPSLRDRLPADLRDGPAGPRPVSFPFTSLYLTDDEWAAELANRTVHGVLHLGLIRDDSGPSRAQLAVYVKPNGLLGEAYMAAIKPFRHLIVYPALTAEIGRTWRARVGSGR